MVAIPQSIAPEALEQGDRLVKGQSSYSVELQAPTGIDHFSSI